ncbi:hypothetical protein [Streptomyces sp. NBC_00842]|uniref:hypothetical protein n=1 Tax=Streptomyces sp. NBC_00842 TaxID=2975848 RepID=UPI002F907342|nr:hypothetical protein OH821_44975 [Streptomyces sp. NBC_00842]
MTTNPVHTAGNAVPPLDDELAGVLDDLAGVHPGIDLIRDGIRLLALDRHSPDKTQTLLATLAGSSDGTDILTALAHLIARLSTADTNPALRTLPLDRQKEAQRHGEQALFALTDPWLHQHASEASAAITGT